MADIDLNISNYNIPDLEKFFQLKRNYTVDDIEFKEYEIREKLLSYGHIDKRFKADLITFLTKAKKILLQNCSPPQPPTTIQTNWKTDNLYNEPFLREPISRENEIITHKNTPFLFANNNEFYAGNLNPLNTRIVSKYMTIDSRFRENYQTKTSDFTVQLPNKLNKVVSMQLSSIELPITFYGISASYGNNFLYLYVSQLFSENEPLIHNEMVLIVPDGNYTAEELVFSINLILQQRNEKGALTDPNNVFSYIRLNLDITKGSGTGKVIVEPVYEGNIGRSIQHIGLDFTRGVDGNPDSIDITTKIGFNLGFTQERYCGKPFYISDSAIDPNSLKYIYLSIEDYQHNVDRLFLSAFNNTNINDNVLARLSIKTGAFSILMENDFNLITEPRKYFGPVDIQKLRIRLYDDHGRILNTNQTNFSFVLLFKILYDL